MEYNSTLPCRAEVRTVKRGGQERVKLMLSDGGLIITGLVSHDCNQGTIADLTNLSIIKVTEYIVQELKSTKPCVPGSTSVPCVNPCACVAFDHRKLQFFYKPG